MRGKKKCDKMMLDLRVAQQIPAFRRSTIARLTREFLEQIAEAIADGEEVHLPALGSLKMIEQRMDYETTLVQGTFKKGENGGKRRVRVQRQLRVCFAKNVSLTKRLKEKHNVNG
jgi:hypothetical protein